MGRQIPEEFRDKVLEMIEVRASQIEDSDPRKQRVLDALSAGDVDYLGEFGRGGRQLQIRVGPLIFDIPKVSVTGPDLSLLGDNLDEGEPQS